MNPIISIRDLQKAYQPKRDRKGPAITAVDGITIDVAAGEFFGLLDVAYELQFCHAVV